MTVMGPTPPVDAFWVHFVAAQGAYGNATEELFVLNLLLCSLLLCRVKGSINICVPQRRAGGGWSPAFPYSLNTTFPQTFCERRLGSFSALDKL